MSDNEPVVEYDEISDAYIVRCPACGADQVQEDAYQGELGEITHYRCRYCGSRFHD